MHQIETAELPQTVDQSYTTVTAPTFSYFQTPKQLTHQSLKCIVTYFVYYTLKF